jgi:aminoglycoside phosphotransferase (APT) family kinase protein
MESGCIRRFAIHGDTKLDNFLFFTRTGCVKALVDFDTIMFYIWLADWGDMVRSMVNVAGEKERDFSRVQVDMDVFRAVARGFCRPHGVRPWRSVSWPTPRRSSPRAGLRFLMDYLRGDSYFKLGPADPPDLNRVRVMTQLLLFRRFCERADEAGRFIEDLHAEFRRSPASGSTEA